MLALEIVIKLVSHLGVPEVEVASARRTVTARQQAAARVTADVAEKERQQKLKSFIAKRMADSLDQIGFDNSEIVYDLEDHRLCPNQKRGETLTPAEVVDVGEMSYDWTNEDGILPEGIYVIRIVGGIETIPLIKDSM